MLVRPFRPLNEHCRSYLYHADRSYALVLGRPNNIQDDYTSSKPPSNIDDVLPVARILNATPLSSPTPMTFVILRHQLASIIGRMNATTHPARHVLSLLSKTSKCDKRSEKNAQGNTKLVEQCLQGVPNGYDQRIYLVLQPRGRDAVQMHSILDGFLKDHEGIPDMDETTRRELKTIEFLKIKASQADNQESTRSRTNGSSKPKCCWTCSNRRTDIHTRPKQRSQMQRTHQRLLKHHPTYRILYIHPRFNGYSMQNILYLLPAQAVPAQTTNQLRNPCWTTGVTQLVMGLRWMVWGDHGLAHARPVDFTAWSGTPQSLVGTPDSRGLDASDWTYWETLVNQIRAPGS
ncbi:RNA polymerase II transcription factor [Salix suchowensis]|nr:RNA polymerase II transcription factor [Salix suchowensis]